MSTDEEKQTVKVEESFQEEGSLYIVCKTPGFPDVVIKKTKCDERMMIDLKVKKNEDGTVVPDESNLVDLYALIQTYKDQCGMEAAKRLLQTGERSPEDFADPRNIQYDDSAIPETPQDRANAAVQANAQVDAVKAKYGIDPNQDMTQEQFENIIKSFIQANPDKFIKPSTNTEDKQ